MTFSIVGRCAVTGQMGVAISSSSPAVAARCSHARAGIGAVATQNVTNPALGSSVLDLLNAGHTAEGAVAAAIAGEPFEAYRQLLVVDHRGNTAVHTGACALGVHAVARGEFCAAGGNLLADTGVPAAMVQAFGMVTGPLGSRLLGALKAGEAAGGEAGPVHSAGLLVVDTCGWPYVDLRVDWIDDRSPIDALSDLLSIYSPQADDYVTRALDPTAAPSYGVPGDEH